MVRGLTVLLACQLVGEVLVRATDAPVPGPVLGMVLLFALLAAQSRRRGAVRRPLGRSLGRSSADDERSWVDGVGRAADGLLRHLQLLFVPAGVGVVVHLSALRSDAVPIAVSLVGSWLAGLLVVGWSVTLLSRRPGRGRA